MAAILKLLRHTESPTPPVDAYVFESHSYEILPGSDLKRQSH